MMWLIVKFVDMIAMTIWRFWICYDDNDDKDDDDASKNDINNHIEDF